ncbi:hypothetical protein C8Q80DRAFT_1167804 [Daedaleopsis nitida]|nr:hypothetical protein C8Q80DRAFT_1167804 [Daedaleopsis nitida]
MPVDLFAFFKKSKHRQVDPQDAMYTRPPPSTSGGRTSTSSDPTHVADAFGRLSLGESGRQGARRTSGGWVGGFTPYPDTIHGPIAHAAIPPPPILHGGAHSTPALAFPQPSQYLPPGPLPAPPAMPMPIPQTSKTMQYALDPIPPPPPPKTGLRPPSLSGRPHSDSGAFPHSNQLHVPITPQRPTLHQAPNSAPAKPASSAPNSRLSPLQTPTKRPRAASTPPSPTSSTASAGKSGNRVQCSGTTKLDKRCTRMVVATAPLSRLDGEDLPHYCHQHMKTAFSDVKFCSHKDSSVWVEYKDWIPEYLQDETKELLREAMRTKHSASDVDGYIYAFEIDDDSNFGFVHIKVGRAVKLTKRLAEWDKQCQSKQTHLRGYWPSTKDADDGNLARGRVQVGPPGPYCHKVERLVHLELADLAVNAPYLDPNYPDVQNVSGNGNDKAVSRKPCPDCNAVHKEIFSFPRAKGRYKGKEWEEIVKPVIEKWGGFVAAYV